MHVRYVLKRQIAKMRNDAWSARLSQNLPAAPGSHGVEFDSEVGVKALKVIIGLLGILVTVPISLYLQYQILKRVDASELMWFLFWVNLPMILLIQIISKIAEDK